VLDRVYRAAASQRVDEIRYNNLKHHVLVSATLNMHRAVENSLLHMQFLQVQEK
jgi:hypothetical protein